MTESVSQPTPTGPPQAGSLLPAALIPADFALFQAASTALATVYNDAAQARCPQELLPGAVAYPRPDPPFAVRRALDFTPFAAALAAFSPSRAATLTELLDGKTIPELGSLLAKGDLTAVELVTYYVDRIARYDVGLNSVIELNPDALTIAAAVDAARADGKPLGRLHGIPVLLKDNIATGDRMHTTAGAYALKEWRADRDALLVGRLRAAGAVILGKTNLSEWANFMDPCMPSGFSVVGGQTRSPYGPYDPAGSSSGSAVAVAANFATIAVGSETSGSLIQPGRFNSIVALRPSLGLVSGDYIIPLAPDLDTAGPMARSVTDAAILLDVLAAPDPGDPSALADPSAAAAAYTAALSFSAARGLRVGVLIPTTAAAAVLAHEERGDDHGRTLTPVARAALLAEEVLPDLGGDPAIALAALAALKIEVVTIDDATLPPAADTALPLLLYGFRTSIAAFFARVPAPPPIRDLADVAALNQADPARRAPYGQALLAAAAADNLGPEDYARVHAVAQALANEWLAATFAAHNIDVLVSGMAYTGNAGAAGVPAITLPAGRDPRGRPQGIIITGPLGSDLPLLTLAYALEQHLKGRVEPDLDTVIATPP